MRTANLTLHTGAHTATFGDVHNVPTPQRTSTWHPIPHTALIEQAKNAFLHGGLQVVNESHALTKDGKRYFGLFQVGTAHDDYGLVVGLRNSHDQSFPAALTLGSHVFVCDNLAFSGEVKLSRKHTARIMRDLPGLVHRAVGMLTDLRRKQDTRIESYKRETLVPATASHLMIRAARVGALPGSQIIDVADQWERPAHPEFTDRTAWSLFNAFTEVLKGNLNTLPKRTQALHGLFDTYCGLTSNVIEGQYAVSA